MMGLRLSFPFIYAILFIYLPIQYLNLNYGWTDIVYFWISSLVLYLLLFKKMKGPTTQAFWGTMVLFIPVTFLFEYVGLWVDGWDFDNKYPLWGIKIFGAPIEEFLFWFGAPPYVMLNYLWFKNAFVSDSQVISKEEKKNAGEVIREH